MTDVRHLFVSPEDTVHHAIAVIDRGAAQVSLVVADDGVLLGTVTDGDIRRGLLRGVPLDAPVEVVMNREFRSVPDSAPNLEVVALMRRELLHQIPVLDDAGRVLGLVHLDDVLQVQALPNAVVLMAGGQGKRLMPLTESRPKPMVDVGGKPLLEIILERCIAAGFRDFYISVNYLKQHIIDHFADGSKWNVSIRYLEELEPLGTAGPLRLLPDRPDRAVLVMNGDVLSSLDLAGLLRFHGDNEASATMCVRTHETQIPFGVVRSQGIHLESFDEKPVLTHFVNAGIYVIAPEILDLIPEGRRYDMPDLLMGAQNVNLPVAVFPIHEYWIDVGNHRALAQANADLL